MENSWIKEFIEKFLKFGVPGILIFMMPIIAGATFAIPLFIPILAIALSPCLVVVAAELFPNVFHSQKWLSKPRPAFSIVRGLKAQEQYEEAMNELMRMTEENPQEIDIWYEMLEIALMDMKDKELAENTYRDAVSVLDRKKSREAITRFYNNITQ